jgi:Cu+-exporting ATPase
VAFDKTGTLTVGRPKLTALRVLPGMTEDEVLRVAASLQSGSEHPLARAVVGRAHEQKLNFESPDNVRGVPGRGTDGEVGVRSFLIGSLRWMDELKVDTSAMTAQVNELQAQGATVSAMAERTTGGLALRALMAFGDEPKAGAKEALAALRARGIKTVMISGDNRGAAEVMARRLGLRPEEGEVLAEVLPGDKAAKVMALKEGGHIVAMVGDGVNDAPALAAAEVGMAMGNGTDVAMHAAGITLMRGDPQLVAAALDISDRTVAKIRQNLFWAFAYNVAGIPLAALGFLNPVVAGAAMALSSVSVMSNALLLKRWKPQNSPVIKPTD